MKRWIALSLALVAALSLAACGRKDTPAPTKATVPLLTEGTEMTEAPATVPETTEQTEPETETTVPETTETVPPETEKQYDLAPEFRRVEETVYATRNVNIRTQPKVSSSSPGKLMKGESVERIGINQSGWSAVIYQDDLYYIASEYLTTKEPQKNQSGSNVKITETAASGTVYTTREVNFRKGPGTDTAAMGRVPGGTKLALLANTSNGWCKVNYGGTVGYIAGGYLTTEAPKVPEGTTPPSETTDPTESSTETKDPTESSAESESKDPSETTKPLKPGDPSDPSETTKATDPSETTKATDPSETTKATESRDASKKDQK